jgi:hypothetical protein
VNHLLEFFPKFAVSEPLQSADQKWPRIPDMRAMQDNRVTHGLLLCDSKTNEKQNS